MTLLTTTLLTLTVLLAGCGTAGTVDIETGHITLTINLFGDFGYHELYQKYEATHPNITIKENLADYGTHHENLQAHLIAGAGAADIEAIEIGQVAGFQAEANRFVNFLDYGVQTDQWTEWKWRAAASYDGELLFGLGTDVGGLALCYRNDYFAKAGLPTDPAKVAALIPDWQSYVDVGKQFLAGYPGDNVKWFDAASNVFSAMVGQADKGYYGPDGQIVVKTNPAVRNAWDTTVSAIQAGESAAIPAFTPQWNTGFAKGQFATVTCPSWMMAEIKTNAPQAAGKWSMTRIPGTGGGNWGGSYLTVPLQSRHIRSAVALAEWLTAPAQEEWLFRNKGNFPSDRALWTQPDVAGYTDPYFHNAAVGKLFSSSALKLKPQPLGAHAGDIGNAFANALVSVEQGKAGPDKAWSNAMADIQNLTG
jgi:cellobiose transport system substrate-binding protein